MFILNKVNELTSSISNQEIDAYLSNILDYKTIKNLFGEEKLGKKGLSSSFNIELFYVLNEDICLNDIGSTAEIGLSYLGGSGIQLYEKISDTVMKPIAFDNSKIKTSYIFADSTYISPAVYFGIDYIEGSLSPKIKKIYKLYNIQTAVGLTQRLSYSNIENLNSEIERILYSVSPKESHVSLKEVDSTLKLCYDDTPIGDVTAVNYDLDGNLVSYNKLINDSDTEVAVQYTDSKFVSFIKNISGENFGFEYTNINGRISNMLSSNHIAIYSALLNFSKGQLDNTKTYLSYLKSIYSDTILYDNWDEFRVLFEKFLNEISKRTIHY